jgi:hypothetical protein
MARAATASAAWRRSGPRRVGYRVRGELPGPGGIGIAPIPDDLAAVGAGGLALEPFHLGLLLGDCLQGDLQAERLPVPAVGAGLRQQPVGVLLDRQQAWELVGVHAQHRAAHAPLTELTGV